MDHHAGGLSPVDPITQANKDLEVARLPGAFEIPVRESRRIPRHHPVNVSKNTFDSEKLKDLQSIYSQHPQPGQNHHDHGLLKNQGAHDSSFKRTQSQTGLNSSQRVKPGAVRIEDAGVEKTHD
jgi:hypothetical protein